MNGNGSNDTRLLGMSVLVASGPRVHRAVAPVELNRIAATRAQETRNHGRHAAPSATGRRGGTAGNDAGGSGEELREVSIPKLRAMFMNSAKLLRGHKNIEMARVTKRWNSEYVVMTEGTALSFLMRLPGVDVSRSSRCALPHPIQPTSHSLNVVVLCSTLPADTETIFGVLGSRSTFINELSFVCDVPAEHIVLVGDYLTMRGKIEGFDWKNMQDNTSEPWRTAVFERPLTVFPYAAAYGMSDSNTAVNTRMIKGCDPYIGTGALMAGVDFYARNNEGRGICTLPGNAGLRHAPLATKNGSGSGDGGGGGGSPKLFQATSPLFAPNSPVPGTPEPLDLAEEPPALSGDAWGQLNELDTSAAQELTDEMAFMDV